MQIFAAISEPKKKKRSQQTINDNNESRSSNEGIKKVLAKLDVLDDSYTKEFKVDEDVEVQDSRFISIT